MIDSGVSRQEEIMQIPIRSERQRRRALQILIEVEDLRVHFCLGLLKFWTIIVVEQSF